MLKIDVNLRTKIITVDCLSRSLTSTRRAIPRRGRSSKEEGALDVRGHRELHQMQIDRLRGGLPGRLLLRRREYAGHSSRRMHRLRGVRAGMSGRGNQAGYGSGSRRMAAAQCRIREALAQHN